MRLKYQLRGLGIGIIITAALLMGFSDDGKASAKTQDAIVQTSTEEETVVKESAEQTQEASVEKSSSMEESITEESTAIEETIAETASESISEEITTEEMTVEEETMMQTTQEEATTQAESAEAVNSTDVVEIKIVSGDDSGTVARKLQIAGLVTNANEYDAYLMQHGYDKTISVGTVEIAKGSSWQEIAEKISGRN